MFDFCCVRFNFFCTLLRCLALSYFYASNLLKLSNYVIVVQHVTSTASAYLQIYLHALYIPTDLVNLENS